jgi:predicted HicB family RNase H-like nuclease
MDNKQVDRRNKWQQENQERVVVMTSKKESPTKEEIKAAAQAAGMSMNAWILDAIRDKL